MKLTKLLVFILVFLLSACGSVMTPGTAETDSLPATVQVTESPELTQAAEDVYPYYLPLVTKPDMASQTIKGVTAAIDWVYVDESRVGIHYTLSGLSLPDGVMLDTTSVRISSTTVSDIGYGGGGGSNTPLENGVINGTIDQLFMDGTLNADEHPSIDLIVDIPVNGTSAIYNPAPAQGNQSNQQVNLPVPEIGTFHFEFDAEVHRGIKLENLDQTVVSNNVSMTLKALVINPSRVEALICFEMPSAMDWGLTASTINLGGREYPFSGGGLLPGQSGKEFRLTDPERCGSVGFDIVDDESVKSITLNIPKLVSSVPEVITKERVEMANKRLESKGIQFNYVNQDHGGTIEILKRPDGATDMEIYPLIWDALAEQYDGPWGFTVDIPR